MKQGGKKKVVQTVQNNELRDKNKADERVKRPCKRRRMSESDDVENENFNSSKRWSSVGVDRDVEPEILEDMGVSMLEEEDAYETKNECENVNQSVSCAPYSSPKYCTLEHNSCDSRLRPTLRDTNGSSRADVAEDFFLFRRKQQTPVKGHDAFSKMSDEMVLMIFRWLPKKMLIRCALVCKRWQRIAYDEILWVRMDLGARALGPFSLGHLLSRGTAILRLAQAEIADPVFHRTFLKREFISKLQYLDLSMAVISEEGLATLLNVCRFLRKLSLEHCAVSLPSCVAIGRNHNLEVLNMSSCYGLTEKCISSILTGCRKLTALNVAWTGLSSRALDTLCTSLPRCMQRINISGCHKALTDKHVRQLVATCPDLVELDLSDCTTITIDTLDTISTLEKIEYLALSRCYSITPNAYTQLSSISSLMYLDVFNLMSEQALANLQKELPDVHINKFLFSSVARPTVGIRRTSIWGLRVRD